jgi:hypothetical protein
LPEHVPFLPFICPFFGTLFSLNFGISPASTIFGRHEMNKESYENLDKQGRGKDD